MTSDPRSAKGRGLRSQTVCPTRRRCARSRRAARVWRGPAAAGTLVPGGAADLVVWDGDPLEPATAPVAVFLNGTEISLRTRQTLLRDRYSRASEERPSAPESR